MGSNPLKEGEVFAITMHAGTHEELRSKALGGKPKSSMSTGTTGAARASLEAPACGYLIKRCDKGAERRPAQAYLTAQKPTVIMGREASMCDLCVPFAHMSRQHAVLSLEAEGRSPTLLYIEDRSTNGTWVNETQLARNSKIRIRSGDQISFRNDSPEYPVYALQEVSLHSNGDERATRQRVN